jgi:threonine/homoserine/homoserine lactone efflux protein
MTDTQILMFVMTSILVILSPGQDMVVVLSRGIGHGAKAGIVTATGVSVGLLGHTALTTLGVGALLLASATLFTVIKILGAAYLLYLGLRLILKPTALNLQQSGARSYRRVFSEGALSNISNPKITIFYFAFLPQFISADADNPTVILMLLGIAFALLTWLIKAPIGYFAGKASQWIQSRPRVIASINRVSGAVLIGFGAKLALEQR